MNELCQFLITKIILDFDTDVDHERLMGFLEDDTSEDGLALKARLTPEKLDDFLIVLSDCLREYIRTGIDEARVAEQIKLFTDA